MYEYNEVFKRILTLSFSLLLSFFSLLFLPDLVDLECSAGANEYELQHIHTQKQKYLLTKRWKNLNRQRPLSIVH